jgi:hypothetical protein
MCIFYVQSCCLLMSDCCALLLFIIVTLLCALGAHQCLQVLCCTLLLFINTCLLHALVVHPCLLIVLFWCSLALFYYVLLLLCTFVIHWHLLDVHSSCLLTPPCYMPPYSSMLQVHVLHWPPSALHHLLLVCFYCSLAPPCYVFLMCALHLLVVHSCCSLAPPCCVFLFLNGTSLLCALVANWHLLAMRSWCSLVLFKLAFHLCISLCRCGRKQFSTSFSTTKYFSNFKKNFYSLFFWSVFFFSFC